MAGRRDCDAVITAGRMSKANEFFAAADHLGEELPNAAGDLYVDAGVAASDVICCVRLGVHSNTGNHNEAVALLKRADSGSERHLNTLFLGNPIAHGDPGPPYWANFGLKTQEDARAVWAFDCDLQLTAGGFDVLAKGVDAAGAQIAVLHLRNAVLSDTDGCCEGGLGVASVFAQLAETVLRNLAIHLIFDCVDAGTVARTATPKIIERGHRFFPFPVFGLAAVAAP